MIIMYIIKQEGLYQNKVNSNLFSNCNCKVPAIVKQIFLIYLWKTLREGFLSPCTV